MKEATSTTDTFDEEGESFLPAPRLLDRMKIGPCGSLLVVSACEGWCVGVPHRRGPLMGLFWKDIVIFM